MLNPNCEYGANFVPIHTLAQWSKCTVDGTMPNQNDSVISGESSETRCLKKLVQLLQHGSKYVEAFVHTSNFVYLPKWL